MKFWVIEFEDAFFIGFMHKKRKNEYIRRKYDWFCILGDTCEIELEILVDKKTAGVLNVGKDSLYDILVLHLENGKDIFVTVAADYVRSVFGASITALVNMSQPFSFITPGQLIELVRTLLILVDKNGAKHGNFSYSECTLV